MNNTELKQAESFLANIVQTAQNDEKFKLSLINNPAKVIKERYGLTVKPDFNCVVDDQTDTSIIYLNIPKPFVLDELELTDEQLEEVSGGVLSSFVCGAVAGAIIVAVGDGFIEGVIDGWNGDTDYNRGL